MALPVLTELNDELSRLYVAGSALAADDERLARFIPGLRALGQKAPVFTELAERLTALLAADMHHSPEALMEAGLLLHALRYTQGTTDIGEAPTDLVYAEASLAPTVAPFSKLSAIRERHTPSELLDWVRNLYDVQQCDDPRLYRYYCTIVADRGELTEFLEHNVFPAIGTRIQPFVEAELDITGGTRNAGLFRILYALKGRDILPLAEQAIASGSVWVACAAILTLADEPRYEGQLVELARDRRVAVKEAALLALITMNSGRVAELIAEQLEGTNIAHLEAPLKRVKDPRIMLHIIEETEKLLPAYRENGAKLKVLLRVLFQRDEANAEASIDELTRDSDDTFSWMTRKLNMSSIKSRLHSMKKAVMRENPVQPS
ncbi:MAG: hypothetical protein LBS86_01800 [Treponema sp.]|jgi:hypothetical protein|nr:hypothetical protein [Treponema sp.]